MGLFKKLFSKATEMAGLDSIKESIAENIPGSSKLMESVSKFVSDESSREDLKAAVSSAIPEDSDLDEVEVDFDDEDFDDEDFDDEDYSDEDFEDEEEEEEEFDEEFDEDEYESAPEESDDDLEEFGEEVDRIIAEREGDLDFSIRSSLASRAESYGITRDEFEKMLDARIEEINDAILAGYDRKQVYRTRSVWRRCPRCGYLNYPNDVYCDWCGYQLRHKAVSAILGALVYMGVSGGNPQKLLSTTVKKTQKKTVKAKKKRVENKAKGIKPKRKASVVAKKKAGATPAKKSLANGSTSAKPEKKKSLFSGSTSAKPEKKKSLFSGSTSAQPEKKKSLFGSSSSSSSKSSSSSSSKKSLFGGSSSSSSSSSSKKKSSLFGGGSSKKSSGLKLGRKRR